MRGQQKHHHLTVLIDQLRVSISKTITFILNNVFCGILYADNLPDTDEGLKKWLV